MATPPHSDRRPDHAQEEQSSSDQIDQNEAEGPFDNSPQIDAQILDVATRVQRQAEQWRDALSVSIGRARQLTGLEETRIRYFETLGALRPAKLADQAGASRLYTLSDLRCLYALALLVKEGGYRPAEAADLVKAHRSAIENGVPGSLRDALTRESNAITDGFLLARLASQLIDAAQIELQPRCADTRPGDAAASSETNPDIDHQVQVVGVLLPMHELVADSVPLTYEKVQQLGRAMSQAPRRMLVALDRTIVVPLDQAQIAPALANSGRNASTVLFYSQGAWELPHRENFRYCFYIPAQHPRLPMMLIVAADQAGVVPPILKPRAPGRSAMLDRLLVMCEQIFQQFRGDSDAKNYRYRSDGSQIEHSRESYQEVLRTLLSLIFPGDEGGMAALLIPDSLDQPISLSILAHIGYKEALASRARLDLSGEGQGLCGRAYKLREPFFSRHASADPRVAYAVEERCQVAMAVPLAASWSLPPFGVLYLASKSAQQSLTNDAAYVALMLGSILGELLGRWWLNRLRRSLDVLLHEHIEDTMHWLDSLDQHGSDFQDALDRIKAIWKGINPGRADLPTHQLALVVLDIDRFRKNVQLKSSEPVPLKAHMHVREAIQKIIPNVRGYWFKNDHVCLILEEYDQMHAIAVVRRIANQVRAVPLDVQSEGDKKISITVSAAIKVLTYQDLYDLDQQGDARLIEQARTIIEDLRTRTSQSEAHTIHVLTPNGWQTMAS